MLFAIALLSSFLTGHVAPGRTLSLEVHGIVFAIIIAATVYVILDIEYPRHGFIRVDDVDQLLLDLHRSMV